MTESYWDRRKDGAPARTKVSFSVSKDPERTREALDANGWLHTGDIGKWLDNGTLKIIDRLKHIFKLAQGEYIAPEKIENILIRSPFVMQIFIHGDSLKVRQHLQQTSSLLDYRISSIGIAPYTYTVLSELSKLLPANLPVVMLCKL